MFNKIQKQINITSEISQLLKELKNEEGCCDLKALKHELSKKFSMEVYPNEFGHNLSFKRNDGMSLTLYLANQYGNVMEVPRWLFIVDFDVNI